PDDLEFVYKQVLHIMHHTLHYASIFLLVNGFQKNKFKDILEEINKWINLKNGKKQNQKTKFNDNFLIVKMPNPDTGYDILLNIACYHLEFNINHAKKIMKLMINTVKKFTIKVVNLFNHLVK
ncbi:MAG: hypothetical protein Q8869_01780, partial [Candidatus Phytoplasma australasiaticum]|nr:hypothetical protein [Candidatus Phytoplasma australasiaticum]